MSSHSIYQQLRSEGLSAAGACGLMGNMNAESAMRANNAQDGMTKLTDAEYTAGVDNGTYTNFVRDAVGYGLCQWTYWTRKQNLLSFAKQKGVSIGDEAMQVEFAVKELKTEYPGLWSFLCATDNVHDAAGRICTEYERPAVNNIAARSSAALRFLNELTNDLESNVEEVPFSSSAASDADSKISVEITLHVLKIGDTGDQVKALQTFLRGAGYDLGRSGIDGDFGPVTESCVRKYQSRNNISDVNGIVCAQTWNMILGAR